MKTKLIALVAFAAGAVAGISHDLAAGAEFEVETDVAEGLLGEGKVKLASPPPAAKKEQTVRARVLVDCNLGKVNDVVDLPRSESVVAEKQGQVDLEKASVAYAAALPQNQPKAA